MNLVIILLVIIPLMALYVTIRIGDDPEWVFSLVLFNIAILVGVNAIALCATGNYEVTATYEQKQYKISGLENKTSQEFYLDGKIGGSFFIGYGEIHGETKTEMNYFYFKESEYGKIIESVPTNEAYIREKDDITPSLIWIVEERLYKGHPNLHKWFFTIRKEDEKQGIKTGTILEVPTNTIKIEYNVDI